MNQRDPQLVVEPADAAHRQSTTAVIRFVVNQRPQELVADRTRRLSDVLRDDLGLTGTKIGCHAGDCGACTVLLGDEQVCSCIVAVGQCEGHSVTTVEGLAGPGGELSALQQAFVTHGAAQCGICTPGMLMSAESLLRHNPHPTEDQVLDALGGVLCRCTGYRKIVDAVLAVAAGLVVPAEVPAAGSPRYCVHQCRSDRRRPLAPSARATVGRRQPTL